MTRARLCFILTLLVSLLRSASSYAQPAPASDSATYKEAPNPLPDLPRLPQEPRSLFIPAPPPGPPGPPLPGPYFQTDPLLDPPCLPPPGWFTDIEIEVVGAHVKNRLVNSVTIHGATDTLSLGSADLDWTVAPRFDFGYRFPAGFGEFLISYRFLTTDGSQTVLSADGPAGLRSRLDLNMVDFDYASREISLWPHCDMKWRIGGRLSTVYFDSREIEPVAEAATDSGLFESHVTNSFVGFGPHGGLELAHHLEAAGLSVFGRTDGAIHLGRLRQGFSATSTTPGPDNAGETHESRSQAVPMLNVQAGLAWKPPGIIDLQVFLGYEYEYWWNMGRDSHNTSRGEMWNQGVLLRAEFNF